MSTALILLIVLMILGAIAALESKDLLSGIISLGIMGFALTIIFLILRAPDLAIVQIIVETITLVILIAAVLKTTRKDTPGKFNKQSVFLAAMGLLFAGVFVVNAYRAFGTMPEFGSHALRMAAEYVKSGSTLTGSANLVTAIILDFRGWDTLGEATVLFAAVTGVTVILRKVGRKQL